MVMLAAVTGLLTGCGDSKFRTSATYQAPDSEFSVTLETIGTVLSGRDLSDNGSGHARIESMVADAKGSVDLEFTGTRYVTYRLPSGPPGSMPWPPPNAGALRGLLERGGVAVASDDELQETLDALNGALAGPKGTLLEGQTKHLRVVEVVARYE